LFNARGKSLRKRVSLQRKLNAFDLTSLVVGSIIGADIYIAAAIGAKLVGPASLLVWILAGGIAVVISLSFAYCATKWPRVGGPYAYVRELSNPQSAFMVGWALLLAEWFSLAVFPVAFVQYLSALVTINNSLLEAALKGLFIVIVLGTNIIGIKAAGRFNDVLTLVKLSPLLLLIVSGLFFMLSKPTYVASNFAPFVTGTAGGFGQALVLIFWAYAGFELSTLPADEIESPRKTIPKAIIIGMLIVISFYLLTNLVIIGSVDQATLSKSQSPLMDSASEIFSPWSSLSKIAPVIVGVGALVSILGADESGTIGTSRLAFALSLDGLMPKAFSKIHGRFQTPYFSLSVLCLTAFVASTFGSLVQLINASVFLLALVYFSTCIAAIGLRRRTPGESAIGYVIPVVGAGFTVVLMALVGPMQIGVSLLLLLCGLPIYILFSPKKELRDLKGAFFSREAVLRRAYDQGERFLAYPWRRILWLSYRIRHGTKPWVVHEDQQGNRSN